jgi:hypothetical protein
LRTRRGACWVWCVRAVGSGARGSPAATRRPLQPLTPPRRPWRPAPCIPGARRGRAGQQLAAAPELRRDTQRERGGRADARAAGGAHGPARAAAAGRAGGRACGQVQVVKPSPLLTAPAAHAPACRFPCSLLSAASCCQSQRRSTGGGPAGQREKGPVDEEEREQQSPRTRPAADAPACPSPPECIPATPRDTPAARTWSSCHPTLTTCPSSRFVCVGGGGSGGAGGFSKGRGAAGGPGGPRAPRRRRRRRLPHAKPTSSCP